MVIKITIGAKSNKVFDLTGYICITTVKISLKNYVFLTIFGLCAKIMVVF